MYLIAGVFGLFFYALYLGIMFLMWSIGVLIAILCAAAMFLVEYYEEWDENRIKKTKNKDFKQKKKLFCGVDSYPVPSVDSKHDQKG